MHDLIKVPVVAEVYGFVSMEQSPPPAASNEPQLPLLLSLSNQLPCPPLFNINTARTILKAGWTDGTGLGRERNEWDVVIPFLCVGLCFSWTTNPGQLRHNRKPCQRLFQGRIILIGRRWVSFRHVRVI